MNSANTYAGKDGGLTRLPSRAATYTRVSTEERISNHSLESQASKLAAFADQQDYTVARQYVDSGHSGAKRARPALAQLLADASAGLFDTVPVRMRFDQ